MLRREDVTDIIDHLMKKPKLRVIKLKLVNSETVIIYLKNQDKYNTAEHINFLEVITKQGNYTSNVYIPYDNILCITGEIDD